MKELGRARLRSSTNVTSDSEKNTCTLPATRDQQAIFERSNTWDSGKYDKTRCSDGSPVRSLINAMVRSEASLIPPKLCMTPLGSPVDPDV